MGCGSSRESGDTISYVRHPPLLEEHVYQLNLPAPPQNGYDSFLTLQWCRDVQEEREEYEHYQKQLIKQQKQKNKNKDKKNKSGDGQQQQQQQQQQQPQLPPPPKKYYLCLRCKYEPYQDNKTINLQKQKDSWKELPKWDDPDFMEDVLSNGPFYTNDAFLLEHVPAAIRPPSDYAYADQYERAYRHAHGRDPSEREIREHQTRVAQTILAEITKYRDNDNRDAKGRDRSRTIQKLEDILASMELDVGILQAAEDNVQQQKQKIAETAEATKSTTTPNTNTGQGENKKPWDYKLVVRSEKNKWMKE